MTPTERSRCLLVYDTAYPDDGVREWPEQEQIETAEAVLDVLLSDSVDLAAESLVDWGYHPDETDQYAACREMASLLRTTATDLGIMPTTTTTTAPATTAPTWQTVRDAIARELRRTALLRYQAAASVIDPHECQRRLAEAAAIEAAADLVESYTPETA